MWQNNTFGSACVGPWTFFQATDFCHTSFKALHGSFQKPETPNLTNSQVRNTYLYAAHAALAEQTGKGDMSDLTRVKMKVNCGLDTGHFE